ncbi:hypothetical protein EBT23_06480 [bacterium]|nr:hypothetical protein [bacterium]
MPQISVTGTLGSVSTTYGTASTNPTSFQLSGTNLAAGITVLAPNGYEVSTNGTDYLSSITVGAAGTLSSTQVSVRLASTTVPGTYTGNVVCSSLAAASVNVATASSTVAKETISVSGVSAVPKTYDGTTTANLTGAAGLVGLEAQDATSVALSAPLANFVGDLHPDGSGCGLLQSDAAQWIVG